MAANTLTAQYSDIQKEVAIQLGWGRDPGTNTTSGRKDWTSENFTDFDLWCKEGYRQFLYPAPLPGENKSHNWSFLYPLGKLTLSTTTLISGGTISTVWTGPDADDNYIISWTRTSGKWLEEHIGALATVTHWTGDTYTATPDTWVSDTVIQGTTTVELEAGPATSFAMNLLYYPLPDDFGGMVSDGFTYRRDSGTWLPDIKIVGEGDIRAIDRATNEGLYPRVACLTPVVPVVGGTAATAESTRWMVRFYPQAETTHNLQYRYHSIPPALDATTNVYHHGGAEHSSTILASIIDVAFQRTRASLEKHDVFLNRLRQSVLHDRRNHTAGYVGHGVKSSGGYSDSLADFRRDTPVANITTPWS
jgi:hypothetical protein